MALKAWIDENDNLYVAGKDNDQEARNATGDEVFAAANRVLEESEGYKLLGWADAHRFRTLWVNPEVFEGDEEHWSDDDWTEASTVEEDELYTKQGWVPVLTIELEGAL